MTDMLLVHNGSKPMLIDLLCPDLLKTTHPYPSRPTASLMSPHHQASILPPRRASVLPRSPAAVAFLASCGGNNLGKTQQQKIHQIPHPDSKKPLPLSSSPELNRLKRNEHLFFMMQKSPSCREKRTQV